MPPFVNPADMLEDPRHNLCHLFGWATKAVSICQPTYHADLVCERARRYPCGVFDSSPLATEARSVTSEGTAGTRMVVASMVRIYDNV